MGGEPGGARREDEQRYQREVREQPFQIGTGLGMIVWFVCSVGMFLLTVASTRRVA